MGITNAETYARARGTGWHIMNIAAVSANQMLEIVEFGQMNGQEALEAGVSSLSYTANVNCSAITGSTSALGNTTGHATSTISNNNGTQITNTTAGKRAISYRGMENPWGNVWNMIVGADKTQFKRVVRYEVCNLRGLDNCKRVVYSSCNTCVSQFSTIGR